MLLSFLFKIFATIAFVYLHQKFYPQYTPDYTLIFADACKLSEQLHHNVSEYFKILLYAPKDPENWYLASQKRAFFAAKLYSPLAWLTGKNFWLTMFYASGLTWAALWGLTNTLIRLFPKYQKAALISFVFLPSLNFWASATSKESWLMIFLAILSIICLQAIYQRLLWGQAIIFLIVLYWLLLLKYYYAFGFLLFVCLYVFLFFTKNLSVRLRIFVAIGFVAVLWGLTHLHPNLQITQFAEALYTNYRLILEASPKGSALDLGLAPTWQSIFLHSPLGFVIGLFAPLPHHISKWQVLPFALENLLILILCVYVLVQIFRGKLQNTKFDEKTKILYICLIAFVIFMATFMGLSSPNFGALSRYKIGYAPFLLYLLLILFEDLRQKRKPHQ
ncbi:MAG: hypothetical protein OHK0045_18320 [Raineya sp.]